jgi:hypothetical protein
MNAKFEPPFDIFILTNDVCFLLLFSCVWLVRNFWLICPSLFLQKNWTHNSKRSGVRNNAITTAFIESSEYISFTSHFSFSLIIYISFVRGWKVIQTSGTTYTHLRFTILSLSHSPNDQWIDEELTCMIFHRHFSIDCLSSTSKFSKCFVITSLCWRNIMKRLWQ